MTCYKTDNLFAGKKNRWIDDNSGRTRGHALTRSSFRTSWTLIAHFRPTCFVVCGILLHRRQLRAGRGCASTSYFTLVLQRDWNSRVAAHFGQGICAACSIVCYITSKYILRFDSPFLSCFLQHIHTGIITTYLFRRPPQQNTNSVQHRHGD